MLVRRNGSTYFYRSVRQGGRVRREYALGGTGAVAELAEALQDIDDGRRELARLERERLGLERDRYRGRDADLGAVVAEAIGVARRLLESLGYRRHARGHWRKRRGHEMGETALATIGQGGTPATLGQAFASPKVLGRMTRLASKGLAKGLDYEGADDQSEEDAKLTNAEWDVQETLVQHARHLAGPTTTPVEWQLCTTAAIVYWELRHAEYIAWHNRVDSGISGKTLALLDRRVDMLRRRYVSVLKALADVRRLAGPTIKARQVNIASGPQQVNNGAQTQ